MNNYQTEHEKQVENISARILELEIKQEKILDLLTSLVDFLHEFSKVEENIQKKGVFHENGYSFNSNDCID